MRDTWDTAVRARGHPVLRIMQRRDGASSSYAGFGGAARVPNVTSFGVVGRLWTLRRLPECHCRSALPRFARRAMLFGLSH